MATSRRGTPYRGFVHAATADYTGMSADRNRTEIPDEEMVAAAFSPDLSEWITAGLTVQSAVAWKDRGMPLATAIVFQWAGISNPDMMPSPPPLSPPTVAQWVHYGFRGQRLAAWCRDVTMTPWHALEWEALGVNPETALAWQHAGLYAGDYRTGEQPHQQARVVEAQWQKSGWGDLDETRRWRSLGVTDPQAAAAWKEAFARFDLDDFTEFRPWVERTEPQTINQVVNLEPNYAAILWYAPQGALDALAHPDGIVGWVQALGGRWRGHIADAYGAATWEEQGFTPAAADPWLADRFSATEAALLRDLGVTHDISAGGSVTQTILRLARPTMGRH